VHDALGRRGGAGRIEKQEGIGRFCLVIRKGGRTFDLVKRNTAALEHLLRLRQADREACAAVAHERLHLGAAVGHVQRAGHRAQACDREIAEHELRRIRELQRHYIAGPDSARAQAGRRCKYALFQVLP
jgi:hypothetical protein